MIRQLVLQIQEPDYGCEERPDDYVAMDAVTLRTKDGDIVVEIPDKELYEKNINVGDRVYFDVRNIIHKEE